MMKMFCVQRYAFSAGNGAGGGLFFRRDAWISPGNVLYSQADDARISPMMVTGLYKWTVADVAGREIREALIVTYVRYYG